LKRMPTTQRECLSQRKSRCVCTESSIEEVRMKKAPHVVTNRTNLQKWRRRRSQLNRRRRRSQRRESAATRQVLHRLRRKSGRVPVQVQWQWRVTTRRQRYKMPDATCTICMPCRMDSRRWLLSTSSGEGRKRCRSGTFHRTSVVASDSLAAPLACRL
jgi:hypothetical protein